MAHENTITVEIDGQHHVIPTVVGGAQLSEDDAIRHFLTEGGGLGLFPTAEGADTAAAARSASFDEPSLNPFRQEAPASNPFRTDALASNPFRDPSFQVPVNPFREGAEPEPPGIFAGGFRAGMRETEALLRSASAIGGHIFGQEEFVREQFGEAARLMEEASGFRQIEFDEAFNSLPNFLKFAAQETGAQIPNLAFAALGAGVGGVTAALTRSMATRVLPGTIAARVAQAPWAKTGALAGAFGATTALESGGIFLEQEEENLPHNAGVALALGAASGILELVPWVSLAGLAGFGPLAKASLVRTLREAGVWTRRGATVGVVGLGEFTTEALQEVNALAARRFVDENFEVLGEEGAQRILEASVTGGIVGTVLGGAGSIFIRRDRAEPGREDLGEGPPRAEGPPPPGGPPGQLELDLPRPIAPPFALTPDDEGGGGGNFPAIPEPPAAVQQELFPVQEQLPFQEPPPTAAGIEVQELTPEELVEATQPEGVPAAVGALRVITRATETQRLNLQGQFTRLSTGIISREEFTREARRILALPTGQEDVLQVLAEVQELYEFSLDPEGGAGPYIGALIRAFPDDPATRDTVDRVLTQAVRGLDGADESEIFTRLEEAGVLEYRESTIRALLNALRGVGAEAPAPTDIASIERRAAEAGIYLDPKERRLRESGVRSPPDNSYNAPGAAPAARGEVLPREEIRVVQEALEQEFGVTIEGLDQDLTTAEDVIVMIRDAVLNGAPPAAFRRTIQLLANLERAVVPARLSTPYYRQVPLQGRLEVENLRALFENAGSGELGILELVLEDVDPDGHTLPGTKIDLEKFHAAWGRRVRSLELVRTTHPNLNTYQLHRLQGPPEAIQKYRDGAEVWVFRHPGLEFVATHHVPGVYGNFFHVRVSIDQEKKRGWILEVQSDYNIQRAGKRSKISTLLATQAVREGQLLAQEEALTGLRERIAELEARWEVGREGYLEPPEGVGGDPQLQTAWEAASAEHEALGSRLIVFQEARDNLILDLKTISQELEPLLHGYRAAELTRDSNNLHKWAILETVRGMAQLGITEIRVANADVVAEHEVWVKSALYSPLTTARDAEAYVQETVTGPLDELIVKVGLRQFRVADTRLDTEEEVRRTNLLVRELNGFRRRMGKAARRYFASRRAVQGLVLQDLWEEANALPRLMLSRPGPVFAAVEQATREHERFTETRPFQVLTEIKRSNPIALRYKRMYEWVKSQFPQGREEAFLGEGGEPHYLGWTFTPEDKWSDQTLPLMLFRDTLIPHTENGARADGETANALRPIWEVLGDNCL